MKRYAMCFSLFVEERARYPNGKKVIRAISFAIIIEPIKVIIISNKNNERRLPVKLTSFLASIVKNLIFLRAHTTANVKNKQERVFQSKYPKYSASGGTKKQVTIAANAAIQNTAFFFINRSVFKSSPLFTQNIF